MGVPKDLFEKNIKRLNLQNLHVIPLPFVLLTLKHQHFHGQVPSRRSRPGR